MKKQFTNLIINFHVVTDIEWLEKTIILLKRKFQMISIHQLSQFYNGELKLENTCHITIDDGDISFYNTIYPLLKKHNIHATLFISPTACRDCLNFWFQEIHNSDKELLIQQVKNLKIIPDHLIRNLEDCVYILKCLPIKIIQTIISNTKPVNLNSDKPQNINLSQLIEISNCDLIEIGAHTLNHPILSNEDDKTSNYEISESITILESLLEKKINYFAYPNGLPNIDFGEREMKFLQRKRIKLAFSTEPKFFSIKDNPMSIPRFSLAYGSIVLIHIKLFLIRYWKIVYIFWHPELKKRKKFIKLVNKILQK